MTEFQGWTSFNDQAITFCFIFVYTASIIPSMQQVVLGFSDLICISPFGN